MSDLGALATYSRPSAPHITFEFLEAAFWSHKQVELPLTVTFVLVSLDTRHGVHYPPAYILASNLNIGIFASVVL